jgi:hypothetical protein
MKRSADHKRLLADALAEPEEFRRDSLEQTLVAVRRRRRELRVRRTIAAGMAMVLATLLLALNFGHREAVPAIVMAPPAPEKESVVHFISDDELLAEFPGRAVGLVGPPERRQLVFFDASEKLVVPE